MGVYARVEELEKEIARNKDLVYAVIDKLTYITIWDKDVALAEVAVEEKREKESPLAEHVLTLTKNLEEINKHLADLLNSIDL